MHTAIDIDIARILYLLACTAIEIGKGPDAHFRFFAVTKCFFFCVWPPRAAIAAGSAWAGHGANVKWSPIAADCAPNFLRRRSDRYTLELPQRLGVDFGSTQLPSVFEQASVYYSLSTHTPPSPK